MSSLRTTSARPSTSSGHVGRDQVVGDDLAGALEPEHGQAGEHLALVRNRGRAARRRRRRCGRRRPSEDGRRGRTSRAPCRGCGAARPASWAASSGIAPMLTTVRRSRRDSRCTGARRAARRRPAGGAGSARSRTARPAAPRRAARRRPGPARAARGTTVARPTPAARSAGRSGRRRRASRPASTSALRTVWLKIAPCVSSRFSCIRSGCDAHALDDAAASCRCM